LTEALVALTALTGRTRHLERATVYLERMRDEALANPFGYGSSSSQQTSWSMVRPT